MDDAQRRVAVLHVADQQADGVQVVDLVELRPLALHLLVDAEEVLGPAADLGVDPYLGELLAQDAHALVDEGLARPASVGEHLDELAVGVRLEVLEGEVLELPLDLPHSESMRERGVNLHRLPRDPDLLVRRQEFEGAHVVEPISQLDDHDAHVLGHRHEHLADVLRLLLLHRPGAPELGELGDPVNETGDLATESLLDVRDGGVGVLGDVVEKGGGECLSVHLEGRQVVRDLHRVGDVRLAGGPQLPLVSGGGDLVGALDQADVDARPMASRLCDDFLDGPRGLPGLGGAGDALHHRGGGGTQACKIHGQAMVARTLRPPSCSGSS